MSKQVIEETTTIRPEKVRELVRWVIEENMKGLKEGKDPLNILLTGPPAIGKTANIIEVCNGEITFEDKKVKPDYFIFHPVVSDPTDFKGLPFAVGKDEPEAQFLPYGDLKKLIYANKPTVAIIDDMGQAPPSVQSAIMQLIWARQIGEHKVSPFVTFVAATNRREDHANVTAIIEPLLSRCITIPMGIHLDDWIHWAVKEKLHPHIIGFVKFSPAVLNETRNKSIENTSSPRTIAMAARAYESAPESIKMTAIAGAAGNAFAVAFAGYVKIASTLPDVDDWIETPSKYKMPEEAGAKYALVYSLLMRVSSEKFDNIHTILEMMEKEYMMTFYHAFVHLPDITPIFTKNAKLRDFLVKERRFLSEVRSFGNE